MNDRIISLFLRTLLFLAPSLALWYLLRQWVVLPSGWLSGHLLKALFPTWVEGFDLQGTELILRSTIKIVRIDHQISLAYRADMLIYCVGLPIFTALLLASRARDWYWKWPAGVAALLPLQLWGTCFQLLMQVAYAAPEVALHTGFTSVHKNVFAACFQIGSLLLPFLGPVMIFLRIEADSVRKLVQEATKSPGNPD